MIVLGIDPGGASTGMVVRSGAELLWWRIVDSPSGAGGLPTVTYLHEVLGAAREALDAHPGARVHVEAVTPPRGFYNGKHHTIAPGALIGVSAVAGLLLGALPDPVLIPPGRNGSRPLATYPQELVGAREVSGRGRLRHARSAWDIAGARPSIVRRAA